MEYTIDELKEVIEIESVVDWLDIPTRQRSSRIQLLCPFHDDHHFGSCHIRGNKIYCFACGEKADAIKLVQHVMNYSFIDACKYIADKMGVTLVANDNTQSQKKVLSDKVLEVIHLCGNRQKIYGVAEIISEEEYFNRETKHGLKHVMFSEEHISENPEDEGRGYYVAQNVLMRNPLQQLLEENEEAYNQLVYGKAAESKEYYEWAIKVLTSTGEKRLTHTADDVCAYIRIKELQEIYGLPYMIEEYKNNILICDKVMQDFSTYDKPQKKSTFGKIKSGISL